MSVLDRFRTAAASPLEERRTLDRRQLLKAGAWAAPVLVLATAAPAAAASTPDPAPAQPAVDIDVYTFAQDNFETRSTDAGNLTLAMRGHTCFNVRWNATNPVTALTLTITTPAAGLLEQTPIVESGDGWKAVSAARQGASMTYTFVFAGNVAANAPSPLLSYRFVADGVTPVGSITPRTATGTFFGSQIKTVTVQNSWGA